jgi:hypothetical protein
MKLLRNGRPHINGGWGEERTCENEGTEGRLMKAEGLCVASVAASKYRQAW